MIQDKVDALLDELIAERNGVIKYAPFIEGRANAWIRAEVEAKRDPQDIPDGVIEQIRADARALVAQHDAAAIALLREELKRPRYASKTPEEMRELLCQEEFDDEFTDGPPAMQSVIDGVLAEFQGLPANLLVTRRGEVMTAGLEPLQARIDAAVAATGKTVDELMAPSRVARRVSVAMAFSQRCWSGIPYCRNVPSLDNIREALA